jgi:hypothetical protein
MCAHKFKQDIKKNSNFYLTRFCCFFQFFAPFVGLSYPTVIFYQHTKLSAKKIKPFIERLGEQRINFKTRVIILWDLTRDAIIW